MAIGNSALLRLCKRTCSFRKYRARVLFIPRTRVRMRGRLSTGDHGPEAAAAAPASEEFKFVNFREARRVFELI